MKALTFSGKEKLLYESIPDPTIIEPTDVIVRVSVCAICGSDLHVYHEREKGIDHGTAMGHEFTGEIVEVGRAIVNFKAGEIVMSPFTTSCGKCFYCSIGLTCRCVQSQLFGWREKNSGLHGGQAEYVRVPLADSTLMKVPEGITQDEALLLGDIIPTGYFCALQAEVKPRSIYAVVGCGPVGLMAILGARALGAENIYAIDYEQTRLGFAQRLGATPVNAGRENPLEKLLEATQGRGADGVMEAVGNRNAVDLAFQILRPGGILSSVGVCTDDHLPFSPIQAYNKNIMYKVGRCPARHLMEKLVSVVQQKKYDYTSIITHRLSLSEGISGYDMFSNKKDSCLKVVMYPA
jgi:threonine dehydrogenase-like Zn-dependent dehydrogenase